MGDCIYEGRCVSVDEGLAALPATAAKIKKRYCEGHHKECVRYRLAAKVGFAAVPDDLYPNQVQRLEALLPEDDLSRQLDVQPQGA